MYKLRSQLVEWPCLEKKSLCRKSLIYKSYMPFIFAIEFSYLPASKNVASFPSWRQQSRKCSRILNYQVYTTTADRAGNYHRHRLSTARWVFILDIIVGEAVKTMSQARRWEAFSCNTVSDGTRERVWVSNAASTVMRRKWSGIVVTIIMHIKILSLPVPHLKLSCNERNQRRRLVCLWLMTKWSSLSLDVKPREWENLVIQAGKQSVLESMIMAW